MSNESALSSIKNFIKENVNFGTLVMNKGIYECPIDEGKSLGISLEKDEDTNKPIYIYNLFIGGEYINISGFGTEEKQIPDNIIKELAKYWD